MAKSAPLSDNLLGVGAAPLVEKGARAASDHIEVDMSPDPELMAPEPVDRLVMTVRLTRQDHKRLVDLSHKNHRSKQFLMELAIKRLLDAHNA